MGRWLLVAALVACKGDAPAKQEPAKPVERPKPAFLEGIELPQVSAGFAPVDGPGHVLSVSPAQMLLDSKPLLELQAGAIDPAHKTDGALGREISPLVSVLRSERKHEVLQLVIDKRITYRVFIDVMYSAKQAGMRKFALVAERGKQLVAAPLTLPERKPASTPMTGRNPGADLGRQIADVRDNSPPSPIATTLREIRIKYVPGVKRCYKDLLKQQPDARGKLALTLTLAESGRVTKAKARGFDTTLDQCVEKQMRDWRFAKQDEADTFALTLQLVPDGEPEPVLDPHEPAESSSGEPSARADIMTAEPATPPADQPVQPIVSMSKSDVIVWSISGLEGTLREPKLRVPLTDPDAAQKIGAALADIVARRWAAQRPETTREIIVQADADAPMQRVAELIGFVREPFPDVLLSTGFE